VIEETRAVLTTVGQRIVARGAEKTEIVVKSEDRHDDASEMSLTRVGKEILNMKIDNERKGVIAKLGTFRGDRQIGSNQDEEEAPREILVRKVEDEEIVDLESVMKDDLLAVAMKVGLVVVMKEDVVIESELIGKEVKGNEWSENEVKENEVTEKEAKGKEVKEKGNELSENEATGIEATGIDTHSVDLTDYELVGSGTFVKCNTFRHATTGTCLLIT
jgi:hypothetical protein